MNVVFEASQVPPPEEFIAGSRSWRVHLYFEGRKLTVPFFTGPAVDPKTLNAKDVLECIIADTIAGETPFNEFCAEYGINPDSRREYAKWRTCRKRAPEVRAFLGEHFATYAG